MNILASGLRNGSGATVEPIEFTARKESLKFGSSAAALATENYRPTADHETSKALCLLQTDSLGSCCDQRSEKMPGRCRPEAVIRKERTS